MRTRRSRMVGASTGAQEGKGTMSKKITISIDEEAIVEKAVERLMHGRYHDDDDEEGYGWGEFATTMQKKIDARLTDVVESAIDEGIESLIQETIHAKIVPMLDAAVARGFAERDRYGDVVRQRPFETYVQASIDGLFQKSNYNDSWAVKAGREAFEKHVEAAFKAETDRVRKAVRKYVDEQLSGAVVKSLREAVGLRS